MAMSVLILVRKTTLESALVRVYGAPGDDLSQRFSEGTVWVENLTTIQI